MPNKLIHSTSPYLLQHAHNPVDWHPWNEETLEKARALDKMLLISIGYSACHWCHVMERESFEDEKVAEIMNRHFVCIKVDREERPDVDQVYMSAVQMITGRGGWPLNCFALPDGRPFFGGTYFRKEQWMNLLENIAVLYETRRNDLEAQAESITEGVRNDDILGFEIIETAASGEDLEHAVSNLKRQFDREDGGLAGAPKFPMPVLLGFLLNYSLHKKDEQVKEFLVLTLRKMAFGGIYDQIGGGFARYSTDSRWHVPHFEKMLYDNAQLVSLYSHAYQAFRDPIFKETVEETLEFIRREMTGPEGGFYSSLDADSEGEEGKFYTWTEKDLREIVGNHTDLIHKYYQVGGDGLWEDNRNILVRKAPAADFARSVGLQPSTFRTILRSAREKLLKARSKRVRPGLDDKILVSWNALMAKGYADAYLALGKPEYLDAAIRTAEFLLQKATTPDGGLYHNISGKSSQINGFLEDYASVIEMLITLYQAGFNERWLRNALDLAEYAIRNFYDGENHIFYFTSQNDPELIARKAEIYDNVIPSSNSMMAWALHYLGLAFDRPDFTDISERMLQGINSRFQIPDSKFRINLSSFANWASLWLETEKESNVIAVTGLEFYEKIQAIRQFHFPGLIYFGSDQPSQLTYLQNRFVEGKTMIYYCTGKECKLPTEDPAEILPYFS
jgi:uncharacterized protein